MNSEAVRAGTIFITGISASGKSTLGKRLQEDLLKSGVSDVKLLDGEEMRKSLQKRGRYYGYSTDERNKIALKFAQIASEYNKQGFICVLCSICHIEKIRQQMRAIIGNVMEVYLDCPVSVCAKRDYKGNYDKAFKGLYSNFIGVTEPYQKSDKVELCLNTEKNSVEESAQLLFKSTVSFLESMQVDSERSNDKNFIIS
jgi:adenylylsulfate kinase-like enzyme